MSVDKKAAKYAEENSEGSSMIKIYQAYYDGWMENEPEQGKFLFIILGVIIGFTIGLMVGAYFLRTAKLITIINNIF